MSDFDIRDLSTYEGYKENITPELERVLQGFAMKPKEFDGMEFLGFEYVDRNDIEADFNDARVEDASVQKQKAFSKVISAGKYLPFNFEPPVVEPNPNYPKNSDKKWKLVNGFHRNFGHGLLTLTHMWCGKAKFENDAVREEYASYANKQDEFVLLAEPRTEADLIKTGISSLKKRDIKKPTATDIRDVIASLKAVQENKDYDDRVFNGIADKFNVKSETIKTTNQKGAMKIYRDLSDDGGAAHAQSYYPGSRDQSWRALQAVADLTEAHGEAPMIVAHVTKVHDTKTLNKTRHSFVNDMIEDIDTCRQVVELADKGFLSVDSIKEKTVFVPQNKAEVTANTMVKYSDLS
jgi:hypothetical protein